MRTDALEADIDLLGKSKIPDLASRRSLHEAPDIPIDAEDPRHRELLVNARDFGLDCFSYYYGARNSACPKNPPYNRRLLNALPDVWVRETVARMLQQADSYWRKRGKKLVLLDGYQPEGLRTSLSALPERGTDLLRSVSYRSGGIVSVALWHMRQHLWVPMGTSLDDQSEDSHVEAFEPSKAAGIRNFDVMENRRALFWTMRVIGFRANPNRWWQFTFGEHMWAEQESHGREPVSAFYAVADPPPELLASMAQ